MTYEETMALLFLAKKMFPRDTAMAVTAKEMAEIGEAWAEMLRDIPFEVGKAAVAAHAASSPFAPAISEIRAYARKLTEKPPLSADEAWSLAIRAIHRYGTGQRNVTTGKLPHEMARDSVPPEVWRVMDLMDYRDMCMSANLDLVRSQFIRAWERQEKLRDERESLLPFLSAGLKERFLALTGGGGAGE